MRDAAAGGRSVKSDLARTWIREFAELTGDTPVVNLERYGTRDRVIYMGVCSDRRALYPMYTHEVSNHLTENSFCRVFREDFVGPARFGPARPGPARPRPPGHGFSFFPLQKRAFLLCRAPEQRQSGAHANRLKTLQSGRNF